MTEKDYVLLLKRKARLLRAVCGYNEDIYGRAMVTTGIPKRYNDERITYENQRTISYDDYIISKSQRSRERRR